MDRIQLALNPIGLNSFIVEPMIGRDDDYDIYSTNTMAGVYFIPRGVSNQAPTTWNKDI